ncbi:FKBP-type peptidyl-prolyl cis-trans isomerase [Cellulomonas sp. JH27-2]|uniref:FKBP-type peptidyl-prolyl cis-trans isomerase n=1 Tax=Cellulomonas sp. JH27-2 TaxID=2774139 RepID=UPI00177B616E|nr:FKBP-type peptidyl-prolyl cis-trans isomerase [Cellulomonas sp. JH27-2]
MRRTTRARGLAAGALTLTMAVTLVACSTDDDASSSPSASSTASASAEPTTTAAPTASAEDVAAVAKIKVTGETGKEPKVTLPETPFTVGALVIRNESDGKGDEIKAGERLSVLQLAVSGADGKTLGSTYPDKEQALLLGSINENLEKELVGKHVGTRVVVASPETADGTATGAPQTNVYVLEVTDAKVVPDRATGEKQAPKDGLPTITLDSKGKPSITPSKADKPTSLVVQPLIKGSGPKVEAGQTVTVKYSGWLWDGTAFDSSWDRDPSTYAVQNIGQGQVITGWNEGLVGQTVGSQVLLVVPPDKGYGDKESGTIPANSTLVFVVDILDAA